MTSSCFKISGSAWIAVLSFVAWLAATHTSTAATIIPGTDPGVTSAFDYTQMTSIVPSHSQVNGSFDIRDMFGGNFGIGQAIFQDTGTTTIYSVTFTLNAPIELMGYTLYLQNDGDDINRALSRFELLDGTTVLSDVIVSSTYDATYGSHSIAIQDTFASVIASTFTARFYGGASAFNGVRVHDLDAIVVPEPSSSALLLGAGPLAMAFARRRLRQK